MTPHNDHRDGIDDALTRAARRAHAASLDHLSPRVQAQLTQRRRTAAQPGRSTGRGWAMIATASAAALALAIGVFVLRNDDAPPQMADRAPPATAPATASPSQSMPDTRVADAGTPAPAVAVPLDVPVTPAAIDTATEDDNAALPDTLIAAEFDAVETIDDAGYDGFDETPDFYAWLGSEDALANAPESL